MAAVRDLTPLISPRSVALVGATDRSNWTVQTVANLRRWSPGVRIEFVHPTRDTVLGSPAVPSLSDLAAPVDLAYVMSPRETVPDVLAEAAAVGTGAAVVLTAGFAELPDGIVWQRRLEQVAAQTGLPVLGPNCSGLVNVRQSIIPFGLGVSELPTAGPAAFVLHSGGLMKPVMGLADAWGIGVHSVIGTGNEAVLSAVDIVSHLLDDDEVGAIGLFLEGFRDPAEFRKAARLALERDRPLVVLPVGRSAVAREAAMSHTGALAGDRAVTSAVLESLGVIEVATLEDLVATTGLLARGIRPRGNRIAVVGASGGAGELLADAAEDNGLVLPAFGAEGAAAIGELLPAISTLANPLDVTGYATVDPTLPVRVTEQVARHAPVDLVLFEAFVTPPQTQPDPEKTRAHFAAVAEMVAGSPVPVLLQDEVADPPSAFAHALFEELGLVWIPGVDIGVRAVGHVAGYVEARARLLERAATDAVTGSSPGPGPWTEPATLAALAGFGVPAVPHLVVCSPAEAAATAASFAGPVAMKIVSPDIAHKSDIGGVALNVAAANAAEAYVLLRDRVAQARPDARIDGVLISPMRSGGVELIAGLHRDPVWGPVLMVGIGGVLVEVLSDVAILPLPVTDGDVDRALDRLRAAPILNGVRGSLPVDRAALRRALTALAEAGAAWDGHWQSVEINPLRCDGDRVEALDALLIPAESPLITRES